MRLRNACAEGKGLALLVAMAAVVCICNARAAYGAFPPDWRARAAGEQRCAICRDVAEHAEGAVGGAAAALDALEARCGQLSGACEAARLPCGTLAAAARTAGARRACQELEVCPRATVAAEARAAPKAAPLSPVDVRVARAHGPKGYAKLRVSVISGGPDPSLNPPVNDTSGIFTYDAPFAHRWTDYRLQSGLVDAVEGGNTFDVGGVKVDVRLAPRGAGVRGVIVADPCFSSEWVICAFGEAFGMLDRLPALLNAAAAGGSNGGGAAMDYWTILGDNFYDRDGELSQLFFSRLSLQTKATPFSTSLGNHDYWVHGFPEAMNTLKDQFGNGAMQFYAMDTLASQHGEDAFIDTSVSPNGVLKFLDERSRLPAVNNSIFYHVTGNVGLLGFSGAYKWRAIEGVVAEACGWFAAQSPLPSVVQLQGHWNDASLGCNKDMSVPAVYNAMMGMEQCAPIADRLIYFEGHTHCNQVVQTTETTEVGIMVGGLGMMSACSGVHSYRLGVTVLDTTNARARVLYYPLSSGGKPNASAAIALEQCWLASGLGGCEHLAQIWKDDPLPALS